METKFKVGDRVRYNGSDEGGSWIEVQVDNTFEGTLVKKRNDSEDEWLVKWDLNPIEIEYDDCLELISRPSDDPKTAFLTELKALLTKYDAYIVLRKHLGYKEKNVMDIVGHSLGLVLCNEIIGQWDSTITPSNIFDYER